MKRADVILLAVASLLYALLYIAFWPRIYSTMDEASYFGNAYVLRQGTIYSDQADVFVPTNFPAKDHLISKYPLGMAALVALVSFAGWPVALGINLFIHLLTFWLTAYLLARVRVPVAFALLYLLHPTAVVYSRTVMSDMASGLLLTLAYAAFVGRRFPLCGFWVGLSLLLRTGNIVALPVFLLFALLPDKAEEKPTDFKERFLRAFWMGLAAVPGVLFAGFYAVVIADGKMAANTGTFGLSYFPDMFPAFVVMLLLLYPGMLLAPILYKGEGKAPLATLCFGFLLLYSFWFYRDKGDSFAMSLVVGMRYMLAVLPLYIVAYSETIWRFIGQRIPSRVLVAAGAVTALGLFALAFKVHGAHAQFLGRMVTVRDAVLQATTPQDRIYCNMGVAKLFHPAWGRRNLIVVGEDADHKQRGDLQLYLSRKTPDSRAVVAYWVRPGRADEQAEADRVKAMTGGLPITPASAVVPPDVFVGSIGPGRGTISTPAPGGSLPPPKSPLPPVRVGNGGLVPVTP